MREESHLDDMRAAIRGDFERLEERRGTQELMHVKEPESTAALEPESAATEAPEPEPEPEPERQPAAAPATEHVEIDEAPEPPARSWLARLLAAIPPRQV